MGSHPSPLDNGNSNGNTDINKQKFCTDLLTFDRDSCGIKFWQVPTKEWWVPPVHSLLFLSNMVNPKHKWWVLDSPRWLVSISALILTKKIGPYYNCRNQKRITYCLFPLSFFCPSHDQVHVCFYLSSGHLYVCVYDFFPFFLHESVVAWCLKHRCLHRVLPWKKFITLKFILTITI